MWNANGLVHHKLEVDQFLLDNNIDIMLISETHFTNKSFVKFNNFQMYNTNQQEYKTAHIQSTSIRVQDQYGTLSISAIYCPPRHAIKKQQYEHFFDSLGSRFLVGGDFNAKHSLWGSRTFNPKGRELHKCIQTRKLKHVSTGQPTYWPSDPNKYPDVIDFCICKGIKPSLIAAQSCLELSSDHSPLIVSIRTTPTQYAPRLHNKQTNWPLFRTLVENLLPLQIPLKTNTDIEDAVEIFNSCIQKASWNATPLQARKLSNPIKDPIIRDQIKIKRRLRKTWQQTRLPSDKTRLNKATKELRLALAQQQDAKTENHLRSLTNSKATNYSLWKSTKATLQPTQRLPPIKSPSNTWAKTAKEKATLFGDHFAKVFEPFPPQLPNQDDEILEYLNSPNQLCMPISSFTYAELKKAISKLNVKKAPGYDLITGKILKEMPPQGITFITQLFNAVLRLSHFPLQWKVAELTLIPKPGKPLEDVASYRPISLLPIISKLFERVLLHRLKPYLATNNIIPNHQFGFREGHSTIEQVHRVYNTLRDALELKQYCSAAFLDVSQAFDKVWHLGLLYKLKMHLPHTFYEILKSYLSNRSFRIKFSDETSQLYKINAGVPQGSVLGPTLYTLFTADLPIGVNTNIATFADDTVVMASSSDPTKASDMLQEHLIKIEKWLNKWRIKANTAKSIHVTFTLRTQTCPPVLLNSTPIPQSDSAKYLGLHLDRRLTWQKHIFTKRKQLGLTLTSLHGLIGASSKMSLQNKILLYKTVIKPIWTYGIQLWGTAAKSNLEIIQRFQSKTLRQIVNAPRCVTNSIIHRDLNIPTIQEEIQKLSRNYCSRLEHHPNSLATNLRNSQGHTRRLQKLIPVDLF